MVDANSLRRPFFIIVFAEAIFSLSQHIKTFLIPSLSHSKSASLTSRIALFISFSESLPLQRYSRGMGVMGLPGDWSSQSRFIRAAFVKMNSVSGEGEEESISQFFHILDTVNQPRGTCKVDHGLEITIYTSCCNADKGIYYYTTYENPQICAVNLHHVNLESSKIISFPLRRTVDIFTSL